MVPKSFGTCSTTCQTVKHNESSLEERHIRPKSPGTVSGHPAEYIAITCRSFDSFLVLYSCTIFLLASTVPASQTHTIHPESKDLRSAEEARGRLYCVHAGTRNPEAQNSNGNQTTKRTCDCCSHELCSFHGLPAMWTFRLKLLRMEHSLPLISRASAIKHLS